MKERDDKRGASGCAIGCLLVGLLLMPVIYVIGVGPAAWFDSQLPQPTGSPLIRALYAPLEYAAEYEPIGHAIQWYVSFWN
jgi:hypothetical protein